jgi:type I restriction enzyme S subunit
MSAEAYFVPSCWPAAKLGDCLDLIRNGTSMRQNREGRGLPVTRIETISKDRINPERVGYLEGLSNKEIREYQLRVGDILLSHINSEPQLGRTALYTGQPQQLIHGMNLLLLRVNKLLDTHFLHFLCAYLRQCQVFISLAGRAVGQSSINQGKLKALQVPTPQFTEQRKIAAILNTVQQAIEQQERLLALTTELKKALLHQLFTHGLRGEPQKQTEIGPVPESWELRALEETGEVVYGIQAAVASNLKPVGTKILTNKNITLDGLIDLEAINYFELKTARHRASVLRNGDLLFNWRSGSKEHVGKTAYFDLDGEFTHSSFILRIRPNDNVTGRYLFYFLNHLRDSAYFVKRQTFAVNAKFNKSAVSHLPVYLPGQTERQQIASALDAVSWKIDVVRRKISALTALFRTLLHLLMTAQIRVHDLNVERILGQAVPETKGD